MTTYLVQPGDTLGKIARKKLGDVRRWGEIAELNKIKNVNVIFVGQTLVLPDGKLAAKPVVGQPSAAKAPAAATVPAPPPAEMPASLALARGYLFVLFDQLPDVGTGKLIRKVAAIPKNFSLLPAKLEGTLSPAEHVLNLRPTESPFLSSSGAPFGAPSIEGSPLLIDIIKAKAAGAQIYTVEEVLRDLRRFLVYNPQAKTSVEKLIWAIEKVEREVLIKGKVPGEAVSPVKPAHGPYLKTAEELWEAFKQKKITAAELEGELAALEKAYARAKIVGRVGRVLTVVGVVFTAVDVAKASEQSLQQNSLKPLGAEAIRQVGGWGGAIAGGKIGFGVGALFGIETGPGAIVTGGIGAIIFGALGYFGADLVADKISPN